MTIFFVIFIRNYSEYLTIHQNHVIKCKMQVTSLICIHDLSQQTASVECMGSPLVENVQRRTLQLKRTICPALFPIIIDPGHAWKIKPIFLPSYPSYCLHFDGIVQNHVWLGSCHQNSQQRVFIIWKQNQGKDYLYLLNTYFYFLITGHIAVTFPFLCPKSR